MSPQPPPPPPPFFFFFFFLEGVVVVLFCLFACLLACLLVLFCLFVWSSNRRLLCTLCGNVDYGYWLIPVKGRLVSLGFFGFLPRK